jgi:hypothetical protein
MHRVVPGLMIVLVAAWLLLGVGCEHRGPLSSAEVITLGDDLMIREGFSWGTPIEILSPESADASGHRWWQLRYVDALEGPGSQRLLIVDGDTGWAQLPYAGYRVRTKAVLSRGSTPPAVVVQDGPFVLLLTPPSVLAHDARGALEAEAARLNAEAASSGLYPLFLVRRDDQGRSALVYGWQSDHGIQRDTAVTMWLSHHSSYTAATWVDLR